ncbi:hypothetical protein Hanom_Chr12g01155461 [Helianthus anomalus]
MTLLYFWTKMAIKLKPQGPRCERFEFWTKVAKVTKPQGPKWQFTPGIETIFLPPTMKRFRASLA